MCRNPEVATAENSKGSIQDGPSKGSVHDGPAPFLLTGVEIKAPRTGFTSPVGKAAVFVSWDRPSLPALQRYNAVRSREEFDKLAADHSLQACEAQAGSNDVCPPAEPAAAAASVEMACPASQSAVPDLACAVPRQAWSGAVHGWLPWLAEEVPIPCAFVELHEGVFDVQAAVSAPRFGRYVVVKLLCAKQANYDNVDVQFVGVLGMTQPQASGSGALA
mmetsp:Transcript_38711/g.115034  ORF Transcript_38711/g.115034 Transcript_38711/m.115034 type:complete len:219 (-) Transcript_38711:1102-1758(-)